MSGRLCSITTSAEVSTGTSEKCILALWTGSGTNFPRAAVKKIKITFDGVSTVAEPIQIKLVLATTQGTAGTTATPVSVNGHADTILSTGGYNFSANPGGTTTVLDTFHVHPQSGYAEIYPLGLEPILIAQRSFGINVIAAASVNALATIWFDE